MLVFKDCLETPGKFRDFGVSSGAGFGAALAIILFSHGAPVYLFAMVLEQVAVLCSFLIGRVYNTTPTIMLVLGGDCIIRVFIPYR